jgi:transposase
MKAKGMSTRAIAAKLGVGKTMLSRWLEEDEEIQ